MAFLKAACHSRIRAIASMPAVTKSLEKPVAGAAGAAASAVPSGKVKTIWFPLKLMELLVRRGGGSTPAQERRPTLGGLAWARVPARGGAVSLCAGAADT